jgi:hypothetical protein
MAFQVSPGVLVQERDLTRILLITKIIMLTAKLLKDYGQVEQQVRGEIIYKFLNVLLQLPMKKQLKQQQQRLPLVLQLLRLLLVQELVLEI